MIDSSSDNFKLMSILGEFIDGNRITKIIVGIITILLFTGVIGIISYSYLTSIEPEDEKFLMNSILPFLVIPLILIILSKLAYSVEKNSENYETEIKNIRTERIIINQKIDQEKEFDIFHTIQLSLNQLNEYYTINKKQARSSFRFSVFAIVIGLITIISGIWLYYLGKTNIEISYISAISGVILEFIGGAYFFIYKKSLEQVNFFFGQLIKIQDTMLSINLTNNIKDETKKTEMKEKIIVSLLERSLK